MKKFGTWTALLLIATIASGCASLNACGGFRYMYPSPQDKLTDGTAKQIAENNMYGEEQKCPERNSLRAKPEPGLLDFLK